MACVLRFRASSYGTCSCLRQQTHTISLGRLNVLFGHAVFQTQHPSWKNTVRQENELESPVGLGSCSG